MSYNKTMEVVSVQYEEHVESEATLKQTIRNGRRVYAVYAYLLPTL